MNQNENSTNVNHASGAVIGFVIVSLIFIVLTVIARLAVKIPAIDADRATAISAALFEIRSNETTSINTVGWVDQPRGIVRLPIETAMQMVEHNWQNPANARADLKVRAEKAAAPAPKVAPKANPFE